MKRLAAFLVAAVLAVPLVAPLLMPPDASAGCKWVTKEVRFLRTYINGVLPFPHDTAYANVGGAADTTMFFTLDGLCPGIINGRVNANATFSGDSALVAVVTFASDTTLAVAPSTTALAYTVQIASPGALQTGSNGNTINSVALVQASTTSTHTSGDDVLTIPIYVKTTSANFNIAYGVLSGMAMRVVVASSTGAVTVPMCRAFVSYPMEVGN